MLTDKQIEQLFKSFDAEGTGYLGKKELRYFCSQYDLGPEVADAIFEELDGDRDGKINFEDFRCGFAEFLAPHHEQKEAEKLNDDVWTNDLWSASGLRDDQVKSLHKELQSIDSPHLINTFESVIEGLLENMRRLQEENRQLENSWRREKKENERHLHRLEEEMDTQVRDMEIKMKQKAREEFEADRKSLRTKMTSEMEKIQDHVFLFEKLATWLKTNNSKWSDSEVCNKLQEAIDENKQLRLSLIDTQANIVLMRNELQLLRKSYEQKCKELDSERQRVLDVLQEQDNLSRQLHLLHDANKTLQDINDSLRENTSHHVNRIYRIASGSTIGDYLKDELQILPSSKRSIEGDDASEIEYWEPSHDPSHLAEWISDDVDSGTSTLRSMSAVSEDFESGRFSDRNDHLSTNTTVSTSTLDCQTILQYDLRCEYEPNNTEPSNEVKSFQSQHSALSPGIKELKKRLGMDQELASYNRNAKLIHRTLPAISEDSIPGPKTEKDKQKSSLTRQYSDECYKATGPAEKTFKVVFVGDSSVGKTSFILRLSRGTFLCHANSTLGLDIQSKVLNIDCHNICLQLWDTAGQERFHSITHSYFRNVHGVMLLYDCTEERSFLNVRQWMEAIGESCPAIVPVQIVGNKVDLRDIRGQSENQKIVTTEDGKHLATRFGALFIETSAQTGYNITESAVNLVRNIMVSQERLAEETSSTICLKDSGSKKKSCCR
uniref:RAS and EF-hand domain-containing protein n=1 Tax=Hadrurus spadix TaxID=141984 RepID=A0A1W7R9T6_9SCOR